MRLGVRKLLLWIGIGLCLIATLFCGIGIVLGTHPEVEPSGYLIMTLPFVIEAFYLFGKTRKRTRTSLPNSIFHVLVFSSTVYFVAITVNLVPSPVHESRAKPILTAIDAYKQEHGHYPARLDELGFHDRDGLVFYDSDGGPHYYKLILKNTGLLGRECQYWIYRFGSNRGKRAQQCKFDIF